MSELTPEGVEQIVSGITARAVADERARIVAKLRTNNPCCGCCSGDESFRDLVAAIERGE